MTHLHKLHRSAFLFISFDNEFVKFFLLFLFMKDTFFITLLLRFTKFGTLYYYLMRTNSLFKEFIYVHEMYIECMYIEKPLNITDKTIFNLFNEKDLS